MNRILLMILRNLWRVPYAYIKLCRYAKQTEKYSEETMYRHIQYILKCAIKGGNVTLKVSGVENIPKDGGFMLYSNHQGMFDIMSIAVTCDRPVGAVMKKELYNIPFLHQIALCTKSFSMDRENLRQSMTVIQAVTREVKSGRGYLIFPEGTRSRNGNEMLEFHHGSFRCAIKAKCPVIPVALIDNHKVLDQKGCKPVNPQIHYLTPILYDEYKELNTTQLAELVKERISIAIKENM